MKVSKRQLKRIIKEEKRKLSESSNLPGYQAPIGDLYVNLDNDQLDALDNLTAVLEQCRALGIPEADIADTIRAGGF